MLEPPHGEFVLMNFHIGSLRHEGQIPFRIMPVLSAVSDYKQELRLQVRAEFADKYHGANVKLTFTVPKTSTGATVELAQGAKQQTVRRPARHPLLPSRPSRVPSPRGCRATR